MCVGKKLWINSTLIKAIIVQYYISIIDGIVLPTFEKTCGSENNEPIRKRNLRQIKYCETLNSKRIGNNNCPQKDFDWPSF